MTEEGWGLLLLDKPAGLTSHTAIRVAARALGAARVGHAGTLDPAATGLLLVGVGRATRLLEELVGLDKVYTARIRLGERRDSHDLDGALIDSQPVPAFSPDEIEAALAPLRGPIQQIPPVHSAIKQGGVPLHRRVRRGETVEVAPRAVVIHALRLLRMELPDLWVEVHCSSGTYVRSLARDVGEALGVGGVLADLRRERCGKFDATDAVTLDALKVEGTLGWRHVIAPERMIDALPRRVPPAPELERLRHGQVIADERLDEEGTTVAVLDGDGLLVALAETRNGTLRPKKVFRPGDPIPSLPGNPGCAI